MLSATKTTAHWLPASASRMSSSAVRSTCASIMFVPNLAQMPTRHDVPKLPPPLVAETSDDALRVSLPDGASASFLLVFVPSLTRRAAEPILDRAKDASKKRIFVSYRQASADARDALRAAGISFAGQDGRVFVHAPGLFVERDALPRLRPDDQWQLGVEGETPVRNPFAKRSSRVPRWLLLNRTESFSLSDLARDIELNPAAVSRVVRGLEEAALVREQEGGASGRRRNVRLERPLALLEAWLPYWQRRRIRHRHWDIGARDVDEALRLLAEATGDRPDGWAVGGLAGAAMVRRAVEPADVLLWTTVDEAERLAKILQPEPARTSRGGLRVAVAPDPWTLGLSYQLNGLPVADSVQLWLDCASEGERALEAAEAVAQASSWL